VVFIDRHVCISLNAFVRHPRARATLPRKFGPHSDCAPVQPAISSTDAASAGQAKGGVIGCTKSVIRNLGVSGAIWLLVSSYARVMVGWVNTPLTGGRRCPDQNLLRAGGYGRVAITAQIKAVCYLIVI